MTFLKKLHKWIGLLLGLQVLLWLLSGLVISLLDPVKVSGQYWSAPANQQTESLEQKLLLEPSELPPEQLRDALGISLTTNRGVPVYRIQHLHGEILLDATNGTVLVFDQADAREIARLDYTGIGDIISVQAGTAPDMETRRRAGAYWKVDFSDQVNTSIYVSAANGQILERRNSLWRVRDFFWMLHIMDYTERENFNNSLIITVVLVAAWLGISGFILLFGSFRRHDFAFLNMFAPKKLATVHIIDPETGLSSDVILKKGSNLFLALATHGVRVPSVCGGGGECGKCRVRFGSPNLRDANSIEKGLIPRPLRKQGYRLACQMEVEEKLKLYLPGDSLVKNKIAPFGPA